MQSGASDSVQRETCGEAGGTFLNRGNFISENQDPASCHRPRARENRLSSRNPVEWIIEYSAVRDHASLRAVNCGFPEAELRHTGATVGPLLA